MKMILELILSICIGAAQGLQSFLNTKQMVDWLRKERGSLLRQNLELTLKLQALTAPKTDAKQDANGKSRIQVVDAVNPHKMPRSSIPTQPPQRAG